jgi:FK506-binding protein 2
MTDFLPTISFCKLIKKAMRKAAVLTVTAGVLVQLASALKENKGQDLPPDADLRIGVKHRPKECPRKSKKGEYLEVHYVGTLFKDRSKQFDSSRERDDPFKFKVGQGQVIPGWDRGMVGMCIGEKRKLVVPSDLAYGGAGAGHDIPGGATLVFEVELINILDDQPDDTNEDYYGYGGGLGGGYGDEYYPDF